MNNRDEYIYVSSYPYWEDDFIKNRTSYLEEELERIFGSFSVDIKTFDDQNVSSTAAVITAEQIQITKKCNDLIDLIVSGISK